MLQSTGRKETTIWEVGVVGTWIQYDIAEDTAEGREPA